MKKDHKINKTLETQPAKSDPVSRRDFFNQAWKWLGIVAALEVLGVFAGFIFSSKPKSNSAPKQLLEAGPADSFAVNSVSAFMGGRFYLARQADGGFIALSLRCTHLGCSITWEEDHKRFICPCHASSFDISGEVLNPPAAKALDYYPVMIENGIVKVDIGTIVGRSSFRKDQLQYV